MHAELRISPGERCQIFLRECLIVQHLKEVVVLLEELVSNLHLINLLVAMTRQVLPINYCLVDRAVLPLAAHAIGRPTIHLPHHVLSELSKILRVQAIELRVLKRNLLGLRCLLLARVPRVEQLLLRDPHGLPKLLQVLRLAVIELVRILQRRAALARVFAVLVRAAFAELAAVVHLVHLFGFESHRLPGLVWETACVYLRVVDDSGVLADCGGDLIVGVRTELVPTHEYNQNISLKLLRKQYSII